PTIEKLVAKIEDKVVDADVKVRKTTSGSRKTLDGGFILWAGAWELNDLPPGTYTVELTALDKEGREPRNRQGADGQAGSGREYKSDGQETQCVGFLVLESRRAPGGQGRA